MPALGTDTGSQLSGHSVPQKWLPSECPQAVFSGSHQPVDNKPSPSLPDHRPLWLAPKALGRGRKARERALVSSIWPCALVAWKGRRAGPVSHTAGL